MSETAFVPQVLRPYQMDAVSAIQEAWEAKKRAPLIAVATGGGKTTIISQVLVESFDPTSQRALVIAHTQEIIGQLAERIKQQFGGKLDGVFNSHHALFAPGLGIVMAEQDDASARIVVATRQSLHAKRLAAILKFGKFDYLVIDESHHALGDNTYGDIVEACRRANKSLRVLGVTATPQRTDRKALKSIFSDIVYQWLIPDGIAGGYLTPVTRIKVATRVDLSRVKTQQGDYAQKQMVSALDMANWLELCVQSFMQHVAKTGRSCLAFMPSVEMSRQFAGAISSAGISAAHIDGETPRDQRVHILSEYAQGRIRVVSNFGVLTEGFDAPRTSVVFLGRPTRSMTLFTQIVGRGLRPYPGKLDCLLVDMTVVDTRALEVGDLLGRMRTCEACGTQFYDGFRHCPACGTVVVHKPVEEQEQDAIEVDGVDERYYGSLDELTAIYEPLFAQAFGAWFWDATGYMSCGLGFDAGTLVIVPPLVDESYMLLYVPKDRSKAIKTLSSSTDVRSLIDVANAYIRDTGAERNADKEARWRSEPATSAQLGLLHTLNVPVAANISRGAASQTITHALTIKFVMERIGAGL